MAQLRLPYFQLSPQAMQGFIAAKNALKGSSIGQKLLELINLRVSQINGCHYCITMHTDGLKKLGETDIRLETLARWRLSTHFTPIERAALAWAEDVTN